jgi:MFS family permease
VVETGIKNPSTLAVLRSHGPVILRLILAYSPITITFYLVTAYGISYMNSTVGFSTSETFSIIMIANLLSVGAVVVGGRAADRIGRRAVLLIGGVGCLAAAVIFFPLVSLHSYPLALLVVAFACVSAQFGNGAHAALFAEAFPTQIRYSGSALALTGVNLIFAAPAPLVASLIVTSFGGVGALAVVWAGFIVLSLAVQSRMKDGRSLEGLPQSFPLARIDAEEWTA